MPTCISERNTLLAVIGVALWIWVMARAGLSAIMHQLRALRVALPIGACGAHWDQFPEGWNVRIRACQQIDLFLGWNQWYFDCIQRVSLMRQGGGGRSRR
jgi:hypothetical protein